MVANQERTKGKEIPTKKTMTGTAKRPKIILEREENSKESGRNPVTRPTAKANVQEMVGGTVGPDGMAQQTAQLHVPHRPHTLIGETAEHSTTTCP